MLLGESSHQENARFSQKQTLTDRRRSPPALAREIRRSSLTAASWSCCNRDRYGYSFAAYHYNNSRGQSTSNHFCGGEGYYYSCCEANHLSCAKSGVRTANRSQAFRIILHIEADHSSELVLCPRIERIRCQPVRNLASIGVCVGMTSCHIPVTVNSLVVYWGELACPTKSS